MRQLLAIASEHWFLRASPAGVKKGVSFISPGGAPGYPFISEEYVARKSLEREYCEESNRLSAL